MAKFNHAAAKERAAAAQAETEEVILDEGNVDSSIDEPVDTASDGADESGDVESDEVEVGDGDET